MPRQGREDRTDLKALSARAHQLSSLIASTSAPGHAAEQSVAHLQAELLQIEKMLVILADTSSAAETRTLQEEDLVTVQEAARLTHVSKYRVYEWAMNQRLPIKQGRYGLLVSLSAVRTLVEEAAAPDSSEGFLPLRTAARLAGVPSHRITSWIRAGKVTIAIGPHGRLLRLVDVQAVADLEARERERDVDEEGTTQPVDRACLWPAGGRDERCDGHSAPSGTAPFMRKRREQRGRVVPRTVLIVDDDAAILDMIQVALDDEGYRTLSSRDGASLQSAHELQPDLILLDPWMRGMDGFEVSERVRSDPATAHIPIVAMSAHPRVRDLSWDLPVHDRLLKPFNLDDLLAKVARWAPSHAEKGK